MDECSKTSHTNYQIFLFISKSVPTVCGLAPARDFNALFLDEWSRLISAGKIPSSDKFWLSLSILSSYKLVSVNPGDNINEAKWDRILDNILIFKW